jgi:hypothetical protein
MKKFLYMQELHLPELIKKAVSLPTSGITSRSPQNLIYLDISDDYVHQLFPLMQNSQLIKPNYFGADLAGAHISIFYPEEKVELLPEDMNQMHTFTIKDAFAAELGAKKYYGLRIESPSLIQLRKKYGLSDQLSFKNHWIDLHITIAVFLLK